MSVDKWLSLRYKPNQFTCSDFCRLVWLDLTGVDIGEALAGLLTAHTSKLTKAHARAFRALREPVDPCLVVMQRPRFPVHLAVYIRGKILQLTPRGVSFESPYVATQMHTSFRYIQCTL